MQSDPKELYKKTAERTGKSEELYKDIGSFVFAETSAMLKRPKSLIIKLKGVGRWYLRKQRMEISVSENTDRDTVRDMRDDESIDSYNEYLKKCEIHSIFKERLIDYQEYLRIKREVMEIRKKTQVLLTPIDFTNDDEKFKSD